MGPGSVVREKGEKKNWFASLAFFAVLLGFFLFSPLRSLVQGSEYLFFFSLLFETK